MQTTRRLVGVVSSSLLTIAVASFPGASRAQTPSKDGRNLDARVELDRARPAQPLPAQSAALDRLRSIGRGDARVTYDRATGAVRTLTSPTGALGRGSLGGAPRDAALSFVQDHLDVLGLVPDDLESHEVKDLVVNRVTGSTHVYLRQRAHGLPVYQGLLQVNLDRDGRVLSVGNSFLPNLRRSINTTSPAVGAEDARRAAAASVGVDLDSVPQERPAAPELMLLPIRRGQARLVWNFQIHTEGFDHYYDFTVDAVTGEVWTRFDWVASSRYTVYPLPLESPNHTTPAPPADGRSLVVDPEDPTASPYGWHDTDGSAGAEHTILRGNNVHAYEDSDANGAPPATEPDCGVGLVCTFPMNLAQAPSTYTDAAVANLFYWNNIVHDIQYQYGFDEAAGNFQVNNYGRGGLDGDDVRAEAQDGAGVNNANFFTPPDGSRPRMQMFLWSTATPSLDGDLDAGIVVHEYGHGISNRLVGGPSSVGCLSNAQQPGEGLSDWWTLAYTARVGDQGTDARGIGTYALNQPTTGPGIRPQRYSTDPAVNTWTYESIDGAVIPHGVGAVWAQAYWEVYWALVDAHGFDEDLYDATGGAGNQRAMLYLNEGLQNTVCSPTFTDVRDGIIQSAASNYGGEDVCLLWEAFAEFGLGIDATSGGPNSTSPANGFAEPAVCLADFLMEVTPTEDEVCAPDDAVFTVTLTENTATNPATLSVTGVPPGASPSFSLNPVTPPASSTLTIGNTGAASTGSYVLDVTGTNASGAVTVPVELELFGAAPGAPVPSRPEDGATGVLLAPRFEWLAPSQAASYLIEVAADAAFTAIVHSATVEGTAYSLPSILDPEVTYFWRVSAANACGDGGVSSTFTFTTGHQVTFDCLTSGSNCTASIPDGNTTGLTSTITVPGGACPVITDVNVGLQATHTWVGDLDFTLSHGGPALAVFDRPGVPATFLGCPANDVDVVLDDEGSGGAIEGLCAPGMFPTSPPAYTPNAALWTFDRADAAGVWTLRIRDLVGWDVGSLVNWSLELTCGTEHPPALPYDFDEDGGPDILWHHQGDGGLYTWLLDATVTAGGSYLSPSHFSDTRWQIRGIADFNDDGWNDILWHHQGNGDLYAWFMNGTYAGGGSFLTPGRFADTRWQIRGVSHFNDDGWNDILWHHQGNGDLYVWFMNGTVAVGGSYLTPSRFADTHWQIRGVADFDGDGWNDILWHHQGTGALYVWFLDGTVTIGGSFLTPSAFSDVRWKIVEVVDFTGDGKVDILWHHQTTGHLYVWVLNGTVTTTGTYLTPNRFSDTQWKVVPR